MEELMKAYDLVSMITPITNRIEFVYFGSIYCMILEEWCKYNNQDIVECIENIRSNIVMVNEADGKY